MERMNQRIEVARHALSTFQEICALPSPTAIERDAAIQRFEYTVEACWKAAQVVLAQRYGVELASPKPVIRASAQNQLLSEADAAAAMDMIDDRNLTSHTYNEGLAASIYSRLSAHADLLQRWLDVLAT